MTSEFSSSEGIDLEAIQARVEKATKGPWRRGVDGNPSVYAPDGQGSASGLIAGFVRGADATFITYARQDILALLAEVLRLRAALIRLRGAPKLADPIDADAAKFLELLLSKCDDGTSCHAWRKCRRCLAAAEVEQRSHLAMRFIAHAISRLRGAQQEETGEKK